MKAILAVVAFTHMAFGADPKKGAKGSAKKVGMVVSTLQDILQSVVNEEKSETTMYNKYVAWCATETAAIAKDSKDTVTEEKNAGVLLEEQASDIDSFKLVVSKGGKEIEETKDAIAQAVALRTTENDAYTEDIDLNTQSIRQIESAIKHVGKVQSQGGFLQNGIVKKLAMNQPGESSYVFGIMKGLKEKLEKTRASLKKTEGEKVAMHNSFMKTKGASLKIVEDTVTAKQIALSETSAKESGTTRKDGKLKEEIETLAASTISTAASCQTTKDEWIVRQTDRTKEKAALNEAIRFLKTTALEQLSLVQKAVVNQDDEDEHASVVFAPSFLQDEVDSKFSDNAFFAAAGAELMGEDDGFEDHMRKDTFNGVQGVVQKLIVTHQDTQKEEKTKSARCVSEIADKEDEQATTTDDLAATKADVDKKSSEVATIADEMTTLEASIVTIKKSLDGAVKIRTQEAALFKSSSKDRDLAMKVLKQAMQVLTDFYNRGSAFAQTAASSGFRAPPKPSGSARKKTASFGAVSMVQDIADDIAKEQKDAAIAEKVSNSELAALRDDSETNTDARRQDVTDRTMAKAKLGVQINALKETQTQQSDDLTAINKQLVALGKSCDELVKNFDKRTKARSFEVSQLRDVMDILSGSSIAARTGLMQDDDI